MKTTTTAKRLTVSDVIDIITADESPFINFAIRGDDFIPVKKFRASRYHGDDSRSFRLPGVSAINIAGTEEKYIVSAIKTAMQYGDNIFLLMGDITNANGAFHDADEVIVKNHSVVGILKV